MGAAGTDNFCLRWNDFAENVSGAFKELREERDFFDVTLACSDSGARSLQAHKVILSACSNFFKATFRQQMNANKHPNPYIYLRGVSYTDLVAILDFIYNGEVNVAQEDLNSFLAVAEELQIKGLTNRDNAGNETGSSSNNAGSARKTVTSTPRVRPAPESSQTPPVKKVRRSSPAPVASMTSSNNETEVKEVVNIKDDPEAMASTSAVNPEEAGAEFGAEDYDESYDGYYEDDGTEISGAGDGADGTKALVRSTSSPRKPKTSQDVQRWQHLIKLEDGKVRCGLCNSIYSCLVSARAHTVRVHELPDYFECCFCKKIFRTKLNFRSHLNLSHGVKGSNLVASYGRLVDETELQHIQDSEILNPRGQANHSFPRILPDDIVETEHVVIEGNPIEPIIEHAD